jgi:uncharacterized protein YndB with AHSA1/START domain
MSQVPLTIRRTMNTSPEELFAAWSQPDRMEQWFFPLRPGWKATVNNDFRTGGSHQLVMLDEENTPYSHTGIYQEIVPNQKIVFTWISDSVKNTLVTVELHSVNDNETEILLTHERLPDKEQYEKHQGGWQECLDHLEEFLGKESYHCEVRYQAPIEKVYEAITEEKGLKHWWTPDCTVSFPTVGAQSTFRFNTTYNVMRIKELVPHKKVVWECIEQYHGEQKFTRTDEWVGTEIIFHLIKNSDDNTELHFIHRGLTQKLECFTLCQKGWNYFLKDSLKAYLETGTGKPYE